MRTLMFAFLFVVTVLAFGAALGGIEDLQPIVDIVEGLWDLAFGLYAVLGA
jgi:hypothetical protein